MLAPDSGGLSAPAATNLLLNIAGTGDAAAQVAAGLEIGHIVQAAHSTAGLAAQLTASNLSQDQAVLVLAAAVTAAGTSALQTQIAALIQGMVTSGPIGIAQVLSDIDGAVVMVHRDKAVEIVDACAAKGISRVWLFKGLGAPGAVSEDAVARCGALGIDVVAGACPLMFLEPVGWFHRVHRGARRLNGSLAKSGEAA